MTKRIYMARIPGTGYFLRCPRWIYNRWPWAGIVRMWDVPDSSANATVEPPKGGEEKL